MVKWKKAKVGRGEGKGKSKGYKEKWTKKIVDTWAMDYNNRCDYII